MLSRAAPFPLPIAPGYVFQPPHRNVQCASELRSGRRRSSPPPGLALAGVPEVEAWRGLADVEEVPAGLTVDSIPSFRLYKGGLLWRDLRGATDPAALRDDLRALIGEYLGGGDAAAGASSSSPAVTEVSSAEALSAAVTATAGTGELAVVMFSAPWCRRCAYLAPAFRAVAKSFLPDDSLVFLSVDLKRLPRLAKPPPAAAAAAAATARTAAGEAANTPGGELSSASSVSAGPCTVCGGGGFTRCPECGGGRWVMRTGGGHQVAVTCPTCVGHGKVRCAACGGRCYMCD